MQLWKATLAGAAIAVGGMAIGALSFGPERADAQVTRVYTECFFGQQEVVDIDAAGQVSTPNRARSIVVPRGYEVVSGGGNARAGHGTILFCRR